MNTHITAAAVFAHFFDNATDIAYNEEWSNGTGYYDGAAKPVMNDIVEIGKVYKTTSTNGRRLILVGTTFGPVVVFDRYAKEGNDIFVYNAPYQLRQSQIINGQGQLHRAALVEIFGDPDMCDSKNVGEKVASLSRMFNRLEKQADEVAA